MSSAARVFWQCNFTSAFVTFLTSSVAACQACIFFVNALLTVFVLLSPLFCDARYILLIRTLREEVKGKRLINPSNVLIQLRRLVGVGHLFCKKLQLVKQHGRSIKLDCVLVGFEFKVKAVPYSGVDRDLEASTENILRVICSLFLILRLLSEVVCALFSWPFSDRGSWPLMSDWKEWEPSQTLTPNNLLLTGFDVTEDSRSQTPVICRYKMPSVSNRLPKYQAWAWQSGLQLCTCLYCVYNSNIVKLSCKTSVLLAGSSSKA